MWSLKQAVKWLLPPIVLLPFRPGFRNTPDGPPSWHRGNYPDCKSAVAGAKGYQASNILDIQRRAVRKVRDGQAVYERDSVIFDKIEYFFPALAALLYTASRNDGSLSVLDFGGALGSTYYQNRHMLSHLKSLRWHVVEQPHFVAAGQAEFENSHLRFLPSIEQSWAVSPPDVVLLSGVLQYLEDPFALLGDIADRKPPFILIDRTPVLDEGGERIVVQTVPPVIYSGSYACRLFAPGALEAALEPFYDVVFDFEAHVGTVIHAEETLARYRGMLFRQRTAKGNMS